MIKFPKSEYYLIKIFYKAPFPMFTWPFLITVINFISSYKVILGLEHVARIEYIRFYLGNTFFSILALLFIVIIYEQNVANINKWIKENDIFGGKDDVINKLNTIHNYFFGRFQFLMAGTGVIARRTIAYFLIPKIAILGNIVIDTIAIFLILSFFLTSIGIIFCLYIAGSNGVKVKYPFEIRERYRDLASLAVRNTLIVGIYLALFGSAVVVWAYQYEQYILGAIVDALIIIGIFIVFVIGIAGIQQGIAMSKQNMLSKIKLEMEKLTPIYASLMESKNNASLSKLYEVILILEGLSRRCKDVEEINEWMFDIGSVIKIVLMSITTLIISALRLILKI